MEYFSLLFISIASYGLSIWFRYMTKRERKIDPLAALKNPATEELRQIYREIDQDILITDPDLLTPEKPKAEKYKTAPNVPLPDLEKALEGLHLEPGEHIKLELNDTGEVFKFRSKDEALKKIRELQGIPEASWISGVTKKQFEEILKNSSKEMM